MSEPNKCAVCGAENYNTNYCDGPELRRMKKDGICWLCAYWENRAAEGCETVIDNYTYKVGMRTSGPFRGMGGRRFDIEYFDGRRVTTFDLWAGSEIPERYRARLPNTARFVNGAERSEAGGITCWNPSEPELRP